MRVTRLDIFGFKSFMERATLLLDGGITGIVGPNGCGKSNVVDALRWVLGESRASSLRGEVLEDVIFNGTEQLRPLGLAEVTLTLRASGPNILSDVLAEERRDSTLNIDAELITNRAGRPHLVVIEGGKEHESLVHSAGSSDLSGGNGSAERDGCPVRPSAGDGTLRGVEDDAGAHAAEADPVLQNGLLAKFSWLQHVTEVQITRRLYRSGESEFFINKVACRLRDIREFFRAVGMGPRAYTVIAQGEVGRIVSARPEERRLVLEETAGIAGFRDRLSEAGRRLEETDTNIARLDDVIKELQRQVQSLRRMAERAKSRAAMRRELQELEEKLLIDCIVTNRNRSHTNLKTRDSLEEELAACGNELGQAVEREQFLIADQEDFDARAALVRQQLATVREEWHRSSQRRAELESRRRELEAHLAAAERERAQLAERQTTLAARREDMARELATLEQQDEGLSREIKAVEKIAEDELTQLAGELAALRGQLRVIESRGQKARDELAIAEGKLQAVVEQVRLSSPLTQLSRVLGEQAVAELAPGARPLIEGVLVPAPYVSAVQAVFGERALFLVADDAHNAGERCLAELERRKAKTDGIALGIFSRGDRELRPPLLSSLPRLIDFLTLQPGVTLGVLLMLEQVYVADSVQEARKALAEVQSILALEEREKITVVTLNGELLTASSFVCARREGGIVSLLDRQRRLADESAKLRSEHEEIVAEREACLKELAATEDRHARALREAETRAAKIRELGRKQGAVRGRLLAERRLVQQIDVDLSQIDRQLAEAAHRREDSALRLDALLEQLEQESGESDEKLPERLATLTEEVEACEQERARRRQELATLSRSVAALRRRFEELQGEVHAQRLAEQRWLLEEQSARERYAEDYGQDACAALVERAKLAAAEVCLTPEVRQEMLGRAKSLRVRMQREGEVDPASVESFEVERARLEELERQRADLVLAATQLRDSMRRITSVAEARFLATYQGVSKRFAELVPRLFGGGKGELSLTRESAPLDGGIEITVRPPGKKPKSIDSLSGGEKALAATALIMAMFLERPSPLCVLDEVDAPLDEANLGRFLQLLGEIGNRTQFIMITHNKQSMIAAHRLVGVTMPTPGATRLISVSLQEAVTHVAAN